MLSGDLMDRKENSSEKNNDQQESQDNVENDFTPPPQLTDLNYEEDKTQEIIGLPTTTKRLPFTREPEELSLRIETRSNLNGTAIVSKIDASKLMVEDDGILVAEDPITGAFCAMKTRIDEKQHTGLIFLDEEVFAASGIGSDEVLVKALASSVISLDKVTLAVSPLSGDEMYPVLADMRRSLPTLKKHLKNYVVFKGLTLRWREKNVSIKILETEPEISVGDVAVFDFTKPRVLSIKPDGVVQFNAILLIDISKSMIGRDLEVRNVRAAIEGIRSAFDYERLDDFLEEFKEGNYVQRKSGAAFAGLLYLSEKVGRGFGETVSIITFADEAEILEVDGKPYITTATGSKGVLDKLAGLVIENVEDKIGVATNMASAIEKCDEVIRNLPRSRRKHPVMIVLLTDGFDTSQRLKEAVQQYLVGKDNVVLYSVGLGPYVNRKELQEVSDLCGGEAYLPEDLEELLEWYGKRARDLTIQLSGK